MVYPGTVFKFGITDHVVLAADRQEVIWAFNDDPYTCNSWSREEFNTRVRDGRVRILRGVAPPRGFLEKVCRSFRAMLSTPDDNPMRSLYNVGDMRTVLVPVDGFNDLLIFAGVNGTRNGQHGLWFSVINKSIGFAPCESMLGQLIPFTAETRDEVKSFVRKVVDGVTGALVHQWWLRR